MDVVIGATEKEYYGKAVAYACELRRKGISVDVIMEPKRLKAILQRGDKLNTGEFDSLIFQPQSCHCCLHRFYYSFGTDRS